MKTGTIIQEIRINATPNEVYSALMDAEKHSAFTGDYASVLDKVNTEFSFYGDYISGINTKLIAGKLIQQQWKAQEETWPEGYFSEVIYELEEIDGTCLIHFTHKGVPLDLLKNLEKGWNDFYWIPLKEYLENE